MRPSNLFASFSAFSLLALANTISSKSKDPKLSDLAIEIKTYLNQIRELAANLS